MSVRPDCRYARSHEWAKAMPDGTALVGITDFAQSNLGDITYVQLPQPGTVFKAGDTFGVVESVKAASDLFAPLGGRVVAVNDALANAPETVNRAPYDDGWMLKLELSDAREWEALLSADAYAQEVG
jgi:glycine cleavage system H protein